MINKFFWIVRAFFYRIICGKVGSLSYIGKPLYINKCRKIFIGNRVRIYPFLRVEIVHNDSSVVIEDNVSVGQSLHLVAFGDLVIRKNTTISANVLITDVDHAYQSIDVHVLDQQLIYNKTEIGENCFIGYGAVIQAGTRLGKQCIVGANAVVRGTFPAYSVIVGAPARIVKRYDVDTGRWRKTNNSGDFLDDDI